MGDYAEDVTKSLVDNIIKDQSLEQKSGTIFLEIMKGPKLLSRAFQRLEILLSPQTQRVSVSVKEFIADIGFIPHVPSLHSSHRTHTKVVSSRGLKHW